MMATIEVVSPTPCSLGEGPYWDPQDNVLRYVDIIGGDVCSLEPQFKEIRKVHVGSYVSFVIPRSANNNDLVISQNLSISILDWSLGTQRVITKVDQEWPKQETRLNDGKCDAKGRLWTGSMFLMHDLKKYELGKGALYSLDSDLRLKQHLSEVSLSNGIAWTADNATMFYIDTMTWSLTAFDFNVQDGEISRQRTAIDFKNLGDDLGYPDGMTIDMDGKLWIAFFDGGRVLRCDAETGKILQTLKFPVSRVTSCCFGGRDFSELFVTSVFYGLTESEMKAQPLAGHVFKVSHLGVKGSPAYTFSG